MTPMRFGSTPHSAARARTVRMARRMSSAVLSMVYFEPGSRNSRYFSANAVMPEAGQVLRGLDAFGIEHQLAMSAASGDDDGRAIGLAGWRQEYRERRVVDVLVPPVLVLLGFVTARFESGRACLPERNDLLCAGAGGDDEQCGEQRQCACGHGRATCHNRARVCLFLWGVLVAGAAILEATVHRRGLAVVRRLEQPVDVLGDVGRHVSRSASTSTSRACSPNFSNVNIW